MFRLGSFRGHNISRPASAGEGCSIGRLADYMDCILCLFHSEHDNLDLRGLDVLY